MDAKAASSMSGRALSPERLYRRADLSKLPFNTTAELEPVDGPIGQTRALDAIRFGTKVDRAGFNLFVIGPNGARMQEVVKALLQKEARERPTQADWVYVNNFTDPDKPSAIELPPGRAKEFQLATHKLIDDLKSALPAVFQSEEYQRRRGAIDEAFQKKQAEAFAALQEKANAQGVTLLRTPVGLALAPAREGEVVPPQEFKTWSEEKRREVQQAIEALERDLEHIIRQLPQWDKTRRDEIRQLNRDTAKYAVDQLIDDVKDGFSDIPRVIQHLEAVRSDLIDNVPMFLGKAEGEDVESPDLRTANPFRRYEVNVLVSSSGQGAPIVEELHPTLANLVGHIDYISIRGALVTNFRLIKGGAIHRANGGYLLLDARSLLTEPFSWAALKRSLKLGQIRIEDVARFLGLTSTVSLEPDPIPLNVKVVLFGDRLLYFLLVALDPDLSDHFKVLADFDDDIARTPDSEATLARLIGSIAQDMKLNPLAREAVELMLEYAARLASHAGKLSLIVEQFRDVLVEADFLSREARQTVIGRAHVEAALAARIDRAARLRDRSYEAILDDVALIDTQGNRIGQINGLSVLELGGFAFGRPSRITCQVRPGSGKVIDIEREVKLGGPIHSKGVLILSGYLAGRYAPKAPMSLFASLVFEQSYGGVEGDSASSAELYALLSALAEVPIRQDLAVTGSVNQHGDIQAIGGANEKIEAFFDICRARGLTGTQGVLIPEANVQHLMLRRDVVEAIAAGKFAVYPARTIDEGIELLTGMVAGARDANGVYPADSINRRVEDRLTSFANVLRTFERDRQPPAPGAPT